MGALASRIADCWARRGGYQQVAADGPWQITQQGTHTTISSTADEVTMCIQISVTRNEIRYAFAVSLQTVAEVTLQQGVPGCCCKIFGTKTFPLCTVTSSSACASRLASLHAPLSVGDMLWLDEIDRTLDMPHTTEQADRLIDLL